MQKKGNRKKLPGVKNISTQGIFQHGGGFGRSVDEFIKLAKMIHGNRYTYERVVYRYGTEKVEITCKKHGPFTILPNYFLQGKGCPQCHREYFIPNSNREVFIKNVKAIYKGRNYDYSQVTYKTLKDPITIICPEHGPFTTTPFKHLHSWSGCPHCLREHRWTTGRFLKKARVIHGEKYDYSHIREIIRSTQKVPIICPIHGKFMQTVYGHLQQKHGCPRCGGIQKREKLKTPFAEWVQKARKIHGDKYEYVEEGYVNQSSKITMICPIHGPFVARANNHIMLRSGCPKCGKVNAAKKTHLSFAEFLKKARKIHRNKYQYDEASYIDANHKVKITCPIHGIFTQTAGGHINTQGAGCPQCGIETAHRKARIPFAEFVHRARAAHGDTYKYIKSSYISINGKCDIICPKHGVFSQNCANHVRGSICPKCSIQKRRL
ncbi:hypothetical protein FACS189491_02490 [Spirochaetia bacterium]|nr:hypothetical protein FACS189491_02490 [Spirochaetia bacterium]